MLPFENAVPLGHLPRHWEHALGYEPSLLHRWLLAYWFRQHNTSLYFDGTIIVIGNWHPYLDLIHRRVLGTTLHENKESRMTALLGNLEQAVTYGLLCDLHTRNLFLAPLAQARTFLKGWFSANAFSYPEADTVLEKETPLPQASIRSPLAQFCSKCLGSNGYVLAEDEGYTPCLHD